MSENTNSYNDIADNWEDIIDIDESELQNRLEREQTKRDTMAQQQNGVVIIPNGNDEFRPKILQRPKTVTILKRPSDQGQNSIGSENENNKPKPQIKTLEQREKEYAEARLRILGSSVSEKVTEDRSKQVFKSSSTSMSTSYNNIINNNDALNQENSQLAKPPDNVVRYPKGPDGTSGFNLRR